MKKILLLLSVLALFLSSAANAYDFEAGGIYYNILSSSDKTCEVTYLYYYSSSNSQAYSGDVSIPETVTYNGTTYTVTEIGSNAFQYCTGLISITIPDSVKEIGSYAFEYCTGLTQVNFNATECTSFSSYIFTGCSNISTFNFGDKVTIIPAYLCYGLTGLTSITIPESVTEIGNYAFMGCTALGSIISLNPEPPTCGS